MALTKSQLEYNSFLVSLFKSVENFVRAIKYSEQDKCYLINQINRCFLQPASDVAENFLTQSNIGKRTWAVQVVTARLPLIQTKLSQETIGDPLDVIGTLRKQQKAVNASSKQLIKISKNGMEDHEFQLFSQLTKTLKNNLGELIAIMRRHICNGVSNESQHIMENTEIEKCFLAKLMKDKYETLYEILFKPPNSGAPTSGFQESQLHLNVHTGISGSSNSSSEPISMNESSSDFQNQSHSPSGRNDFGSQSNFLGESDSSSRSQSSSKQAHPFEKEEEIDLNNVEFFNPHYDDDEICQLEDGAPSFSLKEDEMLLRLAKLNETTKLDSMDDGDSQSDDVVQEHKEEVGSSKKKAGRPKKKVKSKSCIKTEDGIQPLKKSVGRPKKDSKHDYGLFYFSLFY